MDGVIIHKPLGTFVCSNCGEKKEKNAYNEVVGSTQCGDCLTRLREQAARNWVAAIHEIYQRMQSETDRLKAIKEGGLL